MASSIEYVCCNLCGGCDTKVQYANVGRIYTETTQVVRCNQCGLVYLNPRLRYLSDNFAMDEAYLLQFYLPLYQKFGLVTQSGDLDRELNYLFHKAALSQMQPYRVNNRILDVGCAIGLFLAAAQVEGWQSFGIEPSRHLGRYGCEKFGLSIAEGELAQMSFPPDYFDVVTLWDVTEHLLDPLGTYKLIHRVLRPGGLLLLRMPNWQSITRELLGPAWDMFVTDHFYYFTPVTLENLLRQAGFAPKYISAKELVGPEIEEITTKLGPQMAAEALFQVQSRPELNRGSTLTAAAEKVLSPAQRWQKAGNLLRAGALPALLKEARDYARWKLKHQG